MTNQINKPKEWYLFYFPCDDFSFPTVWEKIDSIWQNHSWLFNLQNVDSYIVLSLGRLTSSISYYELIQMSPWMEYHNFSSLSGPIVHLSKKRLDSRKIGKMPVQPYWTLLTFRHIIEVRSGEGNRRKLHIVIKIVNKRRWQRIRWNIEKTYQEESANAEGKYWDSSSLQNTPISITKSFEADLQRCWTSGGKYSRISSGK